MTEADGSIAKSVVFGTVTDVIEICRGRSYLGTFDVLFVWSGTSCFGILADVYTYPTDVSSCVIIIPSFLTTESGLTFSLEVYIDELFQSIRVVYLDDRFIEV